MRHFYLFSPPLVKAAFLRLGLVFLLGSLALFTHCQNKAALLDPIDQKRIEALLDELRPQFPGLQDFPIRLRAMHSSEFMFKAQPQFGLLPPRLLGFYLYVRTDLPFATLGDEGLKAVLKHELAHFVDYQKRSLGQLIYLGLRYGLSPNSNYIARYERSIDREAICTFEASPAAMLAFRRWQMRHLSPKIQKKKQKFYLNEKELEANQGSELCK